MKSNIGDNSYSHSNLHDAEAISMTTKQFLTHKICLSKPEVYCNKEQIR